ncbi:MAG: signal peptidase II [Stellaceae bacterium]
MRRGLIVALAVVALDQAVKAWVVAFFAARGTDVFVVLPVFNLVMAWNHGVSFGLFNGGGGALVFAALAVAIVVALLWWLRRASARGLQLAIGLVIGGAVGNIVDRLARGAVVDFLDFHLGTLHWFAFNVADAAICLGVFFIALDGLLGERGLD